MNKENNTNVQNVTENLVVTNFTLPSQSYVSGLDKNQEGNVNRSMSKTSITSVGVHCLIIRIIVFVQSILEAD